MVGSLENTIIFTVGSTTGAINSMPSDTTYYFPFETPFVVTILQNIYFWKKNS